MRFRLMPRDTAFYDLFASAAENIVEGTRLLDRLVRADAADRPGLAEQLRQVEHRGDEIVHATLNRLNTTFVTPFDRSDIYALTSALDDVQLAAEVRRTVPLSLRLLRLGGEPIVPALVRALRAAVK